MTCHDPEIGKLIALYEFDELNSAERMRFMNHLLSCDDCFQNAFALSPVIEQMRKNPERFLPALAVSYRFGSRLRRILAVASDWFKALGRVPISVRIGVPVGAGALVVFLLLLLPGTKLGDLARIEPVPYRPLRIKAGVPESEADRTFREAMAAYVQENYAVAAQRLELTVQREPDNAPLQFYLGLCYLLSRKVELAIEHLQKAIALGDSSVLERAYWYLGNAWLLKENRDSALAAFRSVTEMAGQYEWEAREIIQKLQSKYRR